MKNLDDRIKGIKSWAEDDRPREKLLVKGRNALSNAELLAIILGSGSVGESALDLARRILNDYHNNLNELGKISVKELVKKYKGVGEAKAINIIAALELGRRRKLSDPLERPKISSSRDAFENILPYLEDLDREEFYVILLNHANKILKVEQISKGGIAMVVVEPRALIKTALEQNATGIILFHNHPSGALKPSTQDINLTKKVSEACKLFDISVLDHLIIGHNNYYSFADEGLL